MSLMVVAITVLLAGAVGSLFASRRAKIALGVGTAAIVMSGALSVLAAIGTLVGDTSSSADLVQWQLPLGAARFAMDALSAWFVLALGILSTAAALYSWGYMQSDIGRRPVPVYAAALCILVVSILIVFTAADIVPFLVGWELMSLSAYFLINFEDRDAAVRRAAWTYLIATHIGTAVGVFPLFALLVARSGGATTFAAFPAAAASAGTAFCVLLFALGMVGFGTKAGFMPMHVWLPVAHPVAPSPVSALMSGIVIKCGIYGLLRLLTWLPTLPVGCGIAVLTVGAAGGIMGILYALSQRHIKRMLAYSSVENIGIIGIGIGIGMLGRSLGHHEMAALGFAGAILHVLNHALFKGLLFLSAGTVLHSTGTADMERLGGLARKMPLNSTVFLIGAVAICALPPLNGFVSEWSIYIALFRQAATATDYSSVAAVGGLTALALIGGLALAAFARTFAVVFLGEARDPQIHPHRAHSLMNGGMLLLAVGCVLVGSLAWLTPALSGVLHRPVAVVARIPVPLDLAMPFSWRPALPVMFLVAVMAALLALRYRLAAPPVFSADMASTDVNKPTWGCGYPYPTARIQYTGSSFGWSLVSSFSQVLRSKRQPATPVGYFPNSTQLETRTPDAAMTRVYEPLFGFIARGVQRLWPLQHGRVQLYLIYMAVTLLVVFVVETYRAPIRPIREPSVQHGPVTVHDANGAPLQKQASSGGDQP